MMMSTLRVKRAFKLWKSWECIISISVSRQKKSRKEGSVVAASRNKKRKNEELNRGKKMEERKKQNTF